jgi:hypothetical protein
MEIWGIAMGTGDSSAACSGGVSNACESSKILSILYRPKLMCISYISEARVSTEPSMMASDE